MLELPESRTIARQLKEMILGKQIVQVIAAQSPHGFAWYWSEPEEYPKLLEGKFITDAYPVAGLVELALEDCRLVLNDGVNIRYLAPGAKLPPKHQLYLALDDDSGLVCTVQMYGGMMAFPVGAYENFYYEVAREKPTPFEDAFTMPYFLKIVADAGPKCSVKALLAAQQRIPGLGNGCLQDILWNAGVNPQSKLGMLDEGDVESLYHSVKDTLAEMVAGGGRDTEKDLFGNPGKYPCILSAKTLAYPCRKCNGGLVRKAYMGGNVYYCPACQPVIK